MTVADAERVQLLRHDLEGVALDQVNPEIQVLALEEKRVIGSGFEQDLPLGKRRDSEENASDVEETLDQFGPRTTRRVMVVVELPGQRAAVIVDVVHEREQDPALAAGVFGELPSDPLGVQDVITGELGDVLTGRRPGRFWP
jgi:hypothetical protein